MDFIPDLDRAVADLATVLDADLLTQLKEDIQYALRGRPSSDYEAYPGLKWDVDTFGGLLADFTGMPLPLCKLAALNHLQPSNRSRISIEALTKLADLIRTQQTRRTASTIIAAAQRRATR